MTLPNAAGLVLTIDLALDGIGVNDDITSFKLNFMTDSIEVPPTASRRVRAYKPGAQKATITLSWLQSEDISNVNEILYLAMTSAGDDGIVDFSGKVADNSRWRWTGSFVASSIETGGDAWTIGQSSATFDCISFPTRVASAS